MTTNDLIIPRPSVLAFARAMELTLRKHDAKKGGQANWREDDLCGLIHHGIAEAGEVLSAWFNKESNQRIASEAIDMANMSMMVWDHVTRSPDADDASQPPATPPNMMERINQIILISTPRGKSPATPPNMMEWINRLADCLRPHMINVDLEERDSDRVYTCTSCSGCGMSMFFEHDEGCVLHGTPLVEASTFSPARLAALETVAVAAQKLWEILIDEDLTRLQRPRSQVLNESLAALRLTDPKFIAQVRANYAAGGVCYQCGHVGYDCTCGVPRGEQ